ncbi:MAG: enoyl-CoA hydratase [Chloroflexota bacterium]|nr:MAG: enoyl-CoA hydratase [Chloroflexota bacterium]
MGYETIQFERDGAVGILTLNRPDAMNSLTFELVSEAGQALAVCENTTEIRTVVITGNGRAFCAGADVSTLRDRAGNDAGRFLHELADAAHEQMILPIRRMSKPVIAAVNGVAAGAGVGLALACDLCVAAEQTKFVLAYSNVAISPDCGTSFFLPRTVGPGKAMELYLFNEPITAQQAQSLGMVNRVVAASELLPTVRDMAQRLAQGPTMAYGQTKRLLDRSFTNGLADHLHDEALSVGNCAASGDHVEAVAAFLAKRSPQFKGR